MLEFNSDVVVVGAGAAGLAAAARLARSRHSLIVFEARDRIGGRCYTLYESGMPVPIELGAEFIHGRSRPIFSLLKQLDIAAIDSAKSHWFAGDEALRRRDDFFSQIRRALRGYGNLLETKDATFERFLKRDLKQKLPAQALSFARTLVEGYDAADPERVSALEVANEWSGGGAADSPSFRPTGGYGALLSALVSTLTEAPVQLLLHSVVRRVRWKRHSVELEGLCSGTPFRAHAERAIITLPLGVLQIPRGAPHHVRFEPALKEKRAALAHISPGMAVKVALRFRSAFWETVDHGRYRNVAFFHATQGPFRTFWTALPMRAPLMIAWIGGPTARKIALLSKAQIVRLALAALASIFGKRVDVHAQLKDAFVHDWLRDPYSQGTYSSINVGGQGAREVLTQPLCDTLFFAGEAVDVSGEAATVGGALQSGIRAARQVLQC